MNELSASVLIAILCLSCFSALALKVNAQQSSISDPSVTLTLLWNYTTGGTVGIYSTYNGWIYLSPVISNNTVYVASGDGYVYALNASSGARIWNYDTGYNVFSSSAVANGVLYVGGFENDYALNATNGSVLWDQVPFYGTGNDVDSSVVVENGVVYIPSDEWGLFALNAEFGYVLWRFPIDNNDGNAVSSSPVVVDGVVYTGGGNTIYALNASNGNQIWNFTTSRASSYSNYPHVSSSTVVGGVIYFDSGDGNIYALNTTYGSRLWNYTYAFPDDAVPSAPTVVEGVVYIGSNNGNVYAVNATGGAKLWSSSTGNGTLSTPAVASEVVYVGSSDDNVYALNAATGDRLGNYTISGSAFDYVHIGAGSPVVVNGILYVGGGNSVYALKISSPTSSSHIHVNAPIVIAVIAVIVIIVVVAFLMFRKRLKTKLASQRPGDGTVKRLKAPANWC